MHHADAEAGDPPFSKKNESASGFARPQHLRPRVGVNRECGHVSRSRVGSFVVCVAMGGALSRALPLGMICCDKRGQQG